jgi:1,4-dihydroxy-2-naphthoate polyprenyltransferase
MAFRNMTETGQPSARCMHMRVLLILGHPRTASLGGVLYAAYRAGLQEVGIPFAELILAEVHFDIDVHEESPATQALEPGLQRAQELILWADHLVFVYPTWWGTFPARLKAFLDRTLIPGFAFRYLPEGQGWKPLLKGKTAELITTMDTPMWVYRWLYKGPGHQALTRATLGFCGIRTVRKTVFGPVIRSTPTQRTRWLTQAHGLGKRLAHGPLTAWQRGRDKATAWLRAMRLQFYPMTWIAYTVGALAAVTPPQGLDAPRFWIGYMLLFFLELATVLSNEYCDYESDRHNTYAGPFNGGSRVLVEGALSFKEAWTGLCVALALTMLCAIVLLTCTRVPAMAFIINAVILGLLALGYTVPPIKLSYRSLGEVDVAVTHSVGVMVYGYVIQGGQWHNPLPWLLGLPLLVAVLPAIILAGMPDDEADRIAAKQTLVVKLGRVWAVRLAMACTVLAASMAVIWRETGLIGTAYCDAIYMVIPHAVLVLGMLTQYLRASAPPGRINGLMWASLSYLLWFGLIALVGLA